MSAWMDVTASSSYVCLGARRASILCLPELLPTSSSSKFIDSAWVGDAEKELLEDKDIDAAAATALAAAAAVTIVADPAVEDFRKPNRGDKAPLAPAGEEGATCCAAGC
jgi:hypothetical protein